MRSSTVIFHITLCFCTFCLSFQVGMAETCSGRCGQTDDYTCDCNSVCIIYKSCCQDYERMCPEEVNWATENLHPLLVDVKMECGRRTGFLEVSQCFPPGWMEELKNFGKDVDEKVAEMLSSIPIMPRWDNHSLERPNEGDMSMLFQKLHDETPIYDTHYKVLFSNMSIYSCYSDTMTFARPWQLVVKIDDSYKLNKIADLADLLQKSDTDYFYAQPNWKLEGTVRSEEGDMKQGRKCFDKIPRDYLFHITVAINNKYLEVNSFPRFHGFQFKTMRCSTEDENEECKHIDCSENSSLINGKCIRHAASVIRAMHPPKYFTNIDLSTVARYFECIIINQGGLVKIRTTTIKQFSAFALKSYSILPREFWDVARFFELTIQSSHDEYNWNMKTILDNALASMYQYLNLVKVSQDVLRFHKGYVIDKTKPSRDMKLTKRCAGNSAGSLESPQILPSSSSITTTWHPPPPRSSSSIVTERLSFINEITPETTDRFSNQDFPVTPEFDSPLPLPPVESDDDICLAFYEPDGDDEVKDAFTDDQDDDDAEIFDYGNDYSYGDIPRMRPMYYGDYYGDDEANTDIKNITVFDNILRCFNLYVNKDKPATGFNPCVFGLGVLDRSRSHFNQCINILDDMRMPGRATQLAIMSPIHLIVSVVVYPLLF